MPRPVAREYACTLPTADARWGYNGTSWSDQSRAREPAGGTNGGGRGRGGATGILLGLLQSDRGTHAEALHCLQRYTTATRVRTCRVSARRRLGWLGGAGAGGERWRRSGVSRICAACVLWARVRAAQLSQYWHLRLCTLLLDFFGQLDVLVLQLRALHLAPQPARILGAGLQRDEEAGATVMAREGGGEERLLSCVLQPGRK